MASYFLKYLPLAGFLATCVYGTLNYGKGRDIEASCSTTCLTSASLSTQGLADLDSVQFAYRGKVIDSLCISHLVLRSSGAVAIEPKDFNGFPIDIQVTGAAKLLEASLSSDVQRLLHIDHRMYPNGLELSPCLLNSGDEVVVDIVTIGDPPAFIIAARITDVEAIQVEPFMRKLPDFKAAQWLMAIIGFLMTFSTMGIWVKGPYVGVKNEGLMIPNRNWLRFFIGAMFASVFLFVALVLYALPNTTVVVILPLGFGMAIPMAFQISRRYWTVYKEIEGEERDRMALGYL